MLLILISGLSYAQVIRTLDPNGNPQFVSPTNRVPVDINGATIDATITGLVPPATLNLSSDTITIVAGGIDSSKYFPSATGIRGNVWTPDGYIKAASNSTITTIIGTAVPYSHTSDFILSTSLFPRHKLYVKNTGSTTCHILYNLWGF